MTSLPESGDGTLTLRLQSAPGRWVLVATVLGSTVVAIDSTVVGIALPAIGRSFGVSITSLQWVVSAYLLSLAGLLLLGGALSDRLGRRRVFVIGVIWFAVASLVCALSPNVGTLIVARGLQGIGGALLTPGSLAILQTSFVPKDRARAVGLWSGLGGVGTAIGPFLGGFLIEAVSWRLVFLINVPLAVVVAALATRHVPETKDPTVTGRLDIVGAVLASAGLLGITMGLIQESGRGWTAPVVLGSVIAGVACVVAFVVVERHEKHPLLDMGLFASRQFSATNVVTFVVYGALGGALFLLPVVLQRVAHYSPLDAGISLLPLTAIMLVFSARSGALAGKIGPRLQMSVGPVLVGGGMLLLRLVGSSGDYLTEVLPGVILLSIGLATTVAPLTATALSSAPTAHAAMASAVNNDVARTAQLVAVAVLPALAGITSAAYLHPAALEAGFRTAVGISAAAAVVGGCIAAVFIRNPAPMGTAAKPAPRTPLSCALEATPVSHH